MQKNNIQLRWGAILSYIQIVSNIIVGLIYTPIMIRTLGQSEYGLYNTVASTISSLSILSLGFNSSYVRFYSKYKKDEDIIAIYKLNGLYMIVFTIIGFVALVCGLLLTVNIELVFSDGLSMQEYETGRKLMLLLAIGMSVSFPTSVFSGIIAANERFIVLRLVGMIRSVLTPVVIIPLLYCGAKSIGVVVVTLILSLITDIVYAYYTLIVLRTKFIFENVDFSIFKEIFIFSIFIAINMIVDLINTNIDKILLGRYQGTIEVAVYSVGASLYSYCNVFSTTLSGVFTPRIHRVVSSNIDNKELLIQELTNLFIKVGRLQYFLMSLIISGIIFFGKYFIIDIWAGPGYEKAYYVVLLLVLPSMVPFIENIGIEMQRALNLHRFRSITYLIMAIINLVLSIILCQKYGAIGSTIGTALATIVANILIMNWFYKRYCYINIMEFFLNILRMSKGLIIPGVFGVFVTININMLQVQNLVLCIGIYIIIFVISYWTFSFNRYEKELLKNCFRIAFK